MKSVLLIGLGRFGRHLAMQLNELGHQVMAVDKEFYIFHTTRPNSMSQKAGSEYEEIVITNYDPRRHNSARHWQLNLFNLSAADEEEGKYTLIHEPTKELKQEE